MDKAFCYFHDNVESISKCSVCGRKICEKCKLIESETNKITCPNCFNNPKAKKDSRDILWFPIVIILIIVIFVIQFLSKNF